MPPRVTPEPWASERLGKDRISAIQAFVDRRLKQGDPDYLEKFQESERMLEELLSLTSDLTELHPENLVGRVDLIADIARFTTGPPISEDDFRTILSLKRIRSDSEDDARRALDLVRGLVDSTRFGWVAQNRLPTKSERRIAIVATASVRAVERVRTGRRTAEKERQERLVAAVLKEMGLEEIAKVRDPDADLKPGSFKRGVMFEGKQCDILIRLYDGRFLAIECKSSNSAVNSIKRLNDVSEKAEVWRRERGAKVVTAAVLAGVFDLRNLETTQDKSVYLFWEHDLAPLKEYIQATKKVA